MAYKLYEFKCDKCEEVQEQLVSNTEGKAEDPCKKCDADPKNLQQVIANSLHGKHFSWSRWQQ